MNVRSGAFCAPAGGVGETAKGTAMICGAAAGARARWASVAGVNPRRRLLDRARKAGVGPIRRGTPDAVIEAMIAALQPAPAAAAAAKLPDRILAAYRELATRPGGSVGLEKLRAHLNADRNDVDRALLEMDDRREIHLEPDPDRRGLTSEAKAAAVTLAGRPTHLLRVRADSR